MSEDHRLLLERIGKLEESVRQLSYLNLCQVEVIRNLEKRVNKPVKTLRKRNRLLIWQAETRN